MIQSNSATEGGGIYGDGSAVTLSNVEVSGNMASGSGGGIYTAVDGDFSTPILTITDSTIDGNSSGATDAGSGGGGIFAAGSAELTNTIVTNNTAMAGTADGGGIFNGGRSFIINGGEISGNNAARAGGGIEVSADAGFMQVIDTELTDNSAGVNGGAVHLSGSSLFAISSAIVTGNTAANEGGGLWSSSTGNLTVNDGTYENNSAMFGGAIFGDGSEGQVQVNGGAFSGNTADVNGGAIAIEGGELQINGATFSTNTAGGNAPGLGGGAIFSAADNTWNNVDVMDNSAAMPMGNGGGILIAAGGTGFLFGGTISGNTAGRAGGGVENAGQFLLAAGQDNGTPVAMQINDNTAGINGGGVHISGTGEVTVRGAEVMGNMAAGEGGGLWNSATGIINVNTTTVSNNVASGDDPDQGGGGIYSDGGLVEVMESTLSDNLADGISGSGGGILLKAATLMAVGTSITGNTAVRAGGGIESTGAAQTTLTDVNLDNNNAGLDRSLAGANIPAPLLAYNFNETGESALATGAAADTDGNPQLNFNANGSTTPADLHSDGGTGVSGDPGDRAFDNTASSGFTNVSHGQNDADIDAIDELSAFTLSGWFQLPSSATESIGQQDSLIENGTIGSGAAGFRLRGGAASDSGTLELTVDGITRESSAVYTETGEYVYFAVSYDGTASTDNVKFYKGTQSDGLTLVDTMSLNAGAVDSEDLPLFIGAYRQAFFQNPFSGLLDNIRIDGSALPMESLEFLRADAVGQTTGFRANPGNGGSLHVGGPGTVLVNGGTISGNFADNEGGGVWNSAAGSITIDGTTIDGNTSGVGGGVYNQAATDGTTKTFTANLDTLNSEYGSTASGTATLTLDTSGVTGPTSGTATLRVQVDATGLEDLAAIPGEVHVAHIHGQFAGNAARPLGDQGDGAFFDGEGGAANGAAPVNSVSPSTALDGEQNIDETTQFGVATDFLDFFEGRPKYGPVVLNLTANQLAAAPDGTPPLSFFFQQVGAGNVMPGDEFPNGTTFSRDTTYSFDLSDPDQRRQYNNLLPTNSREIVLHGLTVPTEISDAIDAKTGAAPGTPTAGVPLDNGMSFRRTAPAASGTIVADSGSVTIMNAVVTNNTATSDNADEGGGGLFNAGSLTVDASSITGNMATGARGSGGGILNVNQGVLDVRDATISNNDALGTMMGDGGGGILNIDGTVSVSDSTISGNNATGTSGSGGGILSRAGTLTVSDTTISSNVANRAGGGIEVGRATVSLDGVTLGGDAVADGNSVNGSGANPGNGGGLHVTFDSTVTIQGGSVSNNSAVEGGGLWNSAVGSLSVSGTTIDSNTALRGGGLFQQGDGSDSAGKQAVRLTIQNLAPDGGPTDSGLFLTPVFNAFQDGSYDLFDTGSAVTPGLERLVEDGATNPLNAEFTTSQSTGVSAALPGGFGDFPPPAVFAPGAMASGVFQLDPVANRYYTYATMVIPSNDAFIGNDDPTAFSLFDADGNFTPVEFTVVGQSVLDAGIEENTEADAAFFDQMAPDLGTVEGGVVTSHPGFMGSIGNSTGTPTILGGTQSVGPLRTFGVDNADFTAPGYQLLKVSITQATVGTSFDGVTLSNNSATGDADGDGGGGIASAGKLSIDNSTVSGNTADGTNANGGGVAVSGGTTTLRSATVADNQGNGGGVFHDGGTLDVFNSVIAANFAGDGGTGTGADVSGPFSKVASSFVGSGDGATGITDGADGNMVGSDAMLGDLADNGGPTMTQLPQSASPLINAGDNTLLVAQPFDQRGEGFDRIAAINTDIGAVEVQDAVAAPIQVSTFDDIVDANDGLISLREAIQLANDNAGANTIELAAGTYTVSITGADEDTNATGDLDVTDDLTITGVDDATTTIDASALGDRAFEIFTATVSISGVTISGGTTDGDGGGILNRGDLDLDGVTVSGNTANEGGGVWNSGAGTLTIDGTTIADNSAVRGGGVYQDETSTTQSFTVDLSTLNSAYGSTATGTATITLDTSGVTGPDSGTASIRVQVNATGLPDLTNVTGGIHVAHIHGQFAGNIARPSADQGDGPFFDGEGGAANGFAPSNSVSPTTADDGAKNIDESTQFGQATDFLDFFEGRPDYGPVVLNLSANQLASAPDGTPPLTYFFEQLAAGNINAADEFPVGTTFNRDTTYTFDLSDADARRQYNNLTPLNTREIVLHGLVVPKEISDAIDAATGAAPGSPTAGVDQGDGTSFRRTAPIAAGVLIPASGTTITNATITGNTATDDPAILGGGGLYNNKGLVQISDSTIADNHAMGAASGGGGIYNFDGSLTVTGSTISGNTAIRAGGGIETIRGSVTLSNVTLGSDADGVNDDAEGNSVAENANPGEGGGLHIGGDAVVSISGSSVVGNAAVQGGGLWNSGAGTLIVNSSTIAANTADDGGGIYNSGTSGDITLTNSTIAGNTATGEGGGIASEGANVTLTSVTIAANSAATGGGIQSDGGTVSAINTIVASNTATTGPDIAGSLTSNGNNLIGDTTDATLVGTVASDILDVDAGLGTLADNGGPTQTIALQTSSPALNAGVAAGLAVDQRGVARPQGTGIDIGAFESELNPPATPTLAITTANADRDEGNSGLTPFTFTVTRSNVTTGATSVDYVVSGSGTNAADANDFENGAFPSGTVNFADGETSKTITVNVAGDVDFENDETFTVMLSGATGGATVTTDEAMGTIRNDDAVVVPTLSIAAANADRLEGNSGSTPFTFTVTRGGNTSAAISVDYTIAGSGVNPANANDFASGFPSGMINFAAGETSQTLTIGVAGDTFVEQDESFTVTLSNATGGASIVSDVASGVIRNDDRVDGNTRILTPTQVVRPHVIPGDGIPTAIIFQAVTDTTVTVFPVGFASVTENVYIVDGNTQQISEYINGVTTADVTAGGLYAVIFEPQTQNRIFSIRSSAGSDSLSNEPSTNILQPTDTTVDGRTTALDALRIINELNQRDSASGEPLSAAGSSSAFLDVNRDNAVTALDALIVINYLNRQDASLAGNPAGESLATVPQQQVSTDATVSISQGDDAIDQVFADGTAPQWLQVGDTADLSAADTVPMMTAASVDAALDADDDDVELLADSDRLDGIN